MHELSQRLIRMLALDSEQDDDVAVGVALPRHVGDLLDSSDRLCGRFLGVFEDQPGAPRATVVAAGHKGDVEALLEQAATDRAADRAGTEDDEAHTALCHATAPGGRCAPQVARDSPPSMTTTWPVT